MLLRRYKDCVKETVEAAQSEETVEAAPTPKKTRNKKE